METTTETTKQRELVIKQSQGKQGKLLFLAIIMVAASTFVLFQTSIYGSSLPPKIIGIVGVLFFGYCLIFIIKRFITPQDVLIVNEKGITDNSSAISLGFIPWEEIKSLYVSRLATETFLSIELFDLDKKLAPLPGYKKNLIKANIKLGYAPISITLNSTKYSPKQVLEEIKNFAGDGSKFIFDK